MTITPDEFIKELEQVFTDAKFVDATGKAGSRALALIDTHTRRGQFTGGRLASMGYSEKRLSMNRVINPSFTPGGGWKTGSIGIPNDEVQWSTSKDGKRNAYLKGGYKRLRELWGRQSGTVDLTFSGSMLRSLFYNVERSANGYIVTVTVSPEQMDKAFQTNRVRNWLELTDAETDLVLETFGNAL